MTNENKLKENLLRKFWIDNQSYIIGLITWTIACLLFSKPINTYIGKVGNFFFDDKHLTIYQWAIIVTFVVYYAIRAINNWWLKAANGLRGRILLILTPFIIWYVLNFFGWMKPEINFLKFNNPKIDLVCVLVFVFIIDLVIKVLFHLRKEKPRYNNSSFITDVALNLNKEEPQSQEEKKEATDETLENIKGDKLGFTPYAERIAWEAIMIKSNESVIFGINGEWGEGKTSMLEIVRQKLEDEKYTVVDFDPWKTNSGKATTQLFFDALKDGLKGKFFGINWKINRYAETLMQLDKSGTGKTLWQLIAPADSIDKQKKQLQNTMVQLDKNLIVFVDDLDRLAKNEIADVLKLMRDTANFPNLVFIAAYDRNYLNKAILDTICSHEAEKYLDKIVLWEFPIQKPEVKRYIDKLYEFLKDKHKDEIAFLDKMFVDNKDNPQQFKDFNELVKNSLTNLREVKRFSNALTFEYNHLKKRKVSFHDLFCLQLIRFISKDYFDLFRKAFYLIPVIPGGNIDNNSKKYIEKINSKNIKKDLLDHIVKYLIENNSCFQSNNPNGFGKFTMARLYFQSNSDKYSLEDIKYKLSKENFEDYKAAADQFVTELNAEKWLEEKAFDYHDLIEANGYSKKYDSLETFLEAIKRMIYFSTQLNEFEFYNLNHNQIRSHCESQFLNELPSIQKSLNQLCADKSVNVKEFCIRIIQDFENERKANRDYISVKDSLVFVKNEFKEYVKHDVLDIDTIRLFKFSYKKLDENIDEHVVKLMKEKAYGYPDQFIRYLIVIDHLIDSERYACEFSGFLLSLFGSYNDLIKFFYSSDFGKNKDIAVYYSQFLDTGIDVNNYPKTNQFGIYLPDCPVKILTELDYSNGKYSEKYK
jgi:hypothetical protein